jgi:competence protein ComFC
MKTVIQKLGRSFVNLLYPPLCLHCRICLQNDAHTLCAACLELLELIDPQERCPLCFSSEHTLKGKPCFPCQRKLPILSGAAAAFDYVGPPATLIRKLKYGDQSYLAKGCGAYMAAQFLQLDWPIPDIIIPVPITFVHWMERGYNQSLLLAESFSEIIKRPIQEALVRKSGDYSQAGLSRKQRINLSGASFTLKSGQNLQDKCILIIDDVMTSGSTMRKCAEALLDECPAHIYGMALCKAIK